MRYRYIKQYDSTDCAVACLASICWHYGRKISLSEIRESYEISKNGASILDICKAAEVMGMQAEALKRVENFDEKELRLPCIAHVYQEDGYGHFVIIYKITKDKVVIADPAIGIVKNNRNDFFKCNITSESPYLWSGAVILFKCSENFEKKKNFFMEKIFCCLN